MISLTPAVPRWSAGRLRGGGATRRAAVAASA